MLFKNLIVVYILFLASCVLIKSNYGENLQWMSCNLQRFIMLSMISISKCSQTYFLNVLERRVQVRRRVGRHQEGLLRSKRPQQQQQLILGRNFVKPKSGQQSGRSRTCKQNLVLLKQSGKSESSRNAKRLQKNATNNVPFCEISQLEEESLAGNLSPCLQKVHKRYFQLQLTFNSGIVNLQKSFKLITKS